MDVDHLIDWRTPLLVQALNSVGLGDLLALAPRSADEIAAHTHWRADLVTRVLRALEPTGLFATDAAGRWSLTGLGQVLTSNHPDSVAAAQLSGFEVGGWTRLLHTLQTGESSFAHTFGMSFWEWLDRHPEDRAAFDEKMRRRLPVFWAMVPEYDWPRTGHVVDVGGGTGSMLIRILTEAPGLTGTVIDLPEAVATAQSAIAASDVADRCRAEVGDFFAGVPSGADLYVLSQILHDWPDDDAVRILSGIRAAMPADAKVLLLEAVVPPEDRQGVRLLDLHMLMMFGAGERDRDQWAALLARAGLSLSRVIEGPYVSWVEARSQG